jgi:hypothetical protein
MIFPWACVKCHDSEHLSEVASCQELRRRVSIHVRESKIKIITIIHKKVIQNAT